MKNKDLIESLKYGNDQERQSETVLPPLEIVG
jgi:hypothetical protein